MPVQWSQKRVPSPAKALGESSSRPLSVLVVEDNRSAADMLGLFFQVEGHEVRVVYDGMQAIHAVRRSKPDLILMDLSMPEMNGLQAAREIRQTDGCADIVIVALSGFDEADDLLSCWDAGFDGHLPKPAGPEDLAELLKQCF